jgi:outer membrane protein OmpA-like peptidoglycan-associated protein
MNRKIRIFNPLIAIFLFASSVANGQDSLPVLSENASRWELNFKLAPMLSQLKSNQYGSEEKVKPGFSIGSDITYYFFNSKKWKAGVSVGLGICLYKANRNLAYNDSAWSTDPLGDQVHIFEQGRFTETQKITCFTIPLKFILHRSVSERMGLYLNVGYYPAWIMSGSYATGGVMSRQGYYPKYNALIYDVDIEGAQLYYPENKSVSNKQSLTLKNFGGISAALGVTYKLTPKFSLFGGITSCFGLSNVSGYNSGETFALVNNDHSLNTLMGRGDQIKANAFGAEFGLTIHLGRYKKQKASSLPKEEQTLPVQQIIPEESATPADTIRPIEAFSSPADSQTSTPDTVSAKEKEPAIPNVKNSPDTTVATPQIEGKDDITQVPGTIELAFTDKDSKVVNPPVNYNPRRVYTLAEVNRLLQQGISLKKKYTVLQRIEFEFNTDKLLEESKQYLDQLVTFMQLQPQCYVRIIGHTDDIGSKTYNQSLSEKRAAAVMNYLISKGIDKERLSSNGYGSDKPIDRSQTPEAREKNRRVEFEINWR